MRYTKYGIIFGLLVVTAGVALTVKFGYRPAPVQILKPSFFDHPEEIGRTVFKRFYVPIGEESVVILGIQDAQSWSPGLLAGFIQAAKESGKGFEQAIVEAKLQIAVRETLRQNIAQVKELDTNTESLSELTELVQLARTKTQKTLVVVPNIYATHLLAENPIDRLERNLGISREQVQKRIAAKQDAALSLREVSPLFSIAVATLALESEQEKELDPVCLGSERDGSGTAPFGCAILNAGRMFYRKRILDSEPGARRRYTAIMQSPLPNDFLLLVREPKSN